MRQIDADPVQSRLVPAGTAVMRDTGAAESGLTEFGGLKRKPAARAKAWDPKQGMTVSSACLIPSIVYALQGLFPIEIYQGTEVIVMCLGFMDMARVFLLGDRPEWPANAPHT